jgi:hypothetical protein
VGIPTKLEELQQAGDEIVVDLDIYTELARYYFSKEAKDRRLKRPTNEVAREVKSIGEPAKGLRARILKYLQELSKVIRDASDSG